MDHSKKREQEKEVRRDKRKEEILSSAERLFENKSIKSTKMTDIAKECELSKGSLYFYFKSKDEIVWHLLKEHSYREYKAGIEYINNIQGNGYEKLKQYFHLFSNQLLESYTTSSPSYQYREYIMGLIVSNDLTEEMINEYKVLVDRNLSTVSNLIKEGINDGSISTQFDWKLLGRAIGNSFGTYFRYIIGLKAAFGEDVILNNKEEFKVFTEMVLSSLKA